MDVLQLPFTSAAVLLAIAGVQKLRDPHALSRALRMAGVPHHPRLVRAFAIVEIIVAVAAITIHQRVVAIAVALLYLAFAAFVVSALGRGLPIQSCGCFGRADAKPSPAHVALNAFAAAVAALVAIDDVEPVRSLIADHLGRGLAVSIGAVALAVLTAAWLRGAFATANAR
jgi:hypothetical protein